MRRRWARLRSLSATQWRSVLVSLVLVPAVQLSLRLRGFVATSTALADRSDRPAKATTADDARSTAEAVAIVAGRPVIGARCLGRSLVLWFLLRRRGIDAALIIGAGAREPRAPLPAHAWVEINGLPINETADVRDRYPAFDLPLPRLAPARDAPSTP